MGTSPFSTDQVYSVRGAILNNMWRILFQPATLTPDQRRDLENLLALARDEAVNLFEDGGE